MEITREESIDRALSDGADRRAAAAELDRNVVVLAGAGTGKTTLLIERLTGLILTRETPVEQIVALTFTKKAAEEMRVRLENRLRAVIAKPESERQASLASRAIEG